MTFNWGHKLTLGFVAFAGMMVFLVYQSMQTRYDLVSKEYYKDELQYQQVIDGTRRAHQLSSAVSAVQTDSAFIIRFPAEMKQQPVTGSAWFYCADDAQKDRKMNLQLNEDGLQYVDRRLLLPGNYTIKLRWELNDQQYYSELYTTIH